MKTPRGVESRLGRYQIDTIKTNVGSLDPGTYSDFYDFTIRATQNRLENSHIST